MGRGEGEGEVGQQQKHKPMFTVDIMALFMVLGAGRGEREGGETRCRKGSGRMIGGGFKNRRNGREGMKNEKEGEKGRGQMV